MNRIFAIALNTFREAIRNKVLYSLLFFAIALIGFALALGQMSLHEELRVTRDLGLGGIALFGVLIAIFVGVNLVYKELDKKTVFSLIPKPLHRYEFVLGKFIGMVLTLAVLVGIMGTVLIGVMLIQGGGMEPALLRAMVLLFGEVIVVTSLALLFSSFSTPFLSGLFTLGLFIVGRSTPELDQLIEKIGSPGVRTIARAGMRIFPDLHLFYVSGSMVDNQYVTVHQDYVDWTYVAAALGYGAAYTACALFIASVLFSRRDFV